MLLNSIELQSEEMTIFANLTHPSYYKRKKNIYNVVKNTFFQVKFWLSYQCNINSLINKGVSKILHPDQSKVQGAPHT